MKYLTNLVVITTLLTRINCQYSPIINRKDYGFPPRSVSDFFTPKDDLQSNNNYGQDVGSSLERDIGQDFGQDIGSNLRTNIGPYNGQGHDFGPNSYGPQDANNQFSHRNRDSYQPPTYYNRQPVDRSQAYYGGHFGLPTGSADHTGPPDFDSDRSLTPEELESKKHNPVPFFINPLIRRGTQGLQRFEANFVRDPKKHQIVKPILALLTNPSKKK